MVDNNDKETAPSYISFLFPDDPKFIKRMRDNYFVSGFGEEEEKKLFLNTDIISLSPGEFYFDSSNQELTINFEMNCSEGDSFGSMCIKLSDEVLMDILAYSVKKLNKLKTALETLK